MNSRNRNLTTNRAGQGGSLAKLQVLVRYLLDVWPSLLQRREFLRSMAQNDALRINLEKTYAGHVFNAMHASLSADLIRCIGAYILDTRTQTASVARAVIALRRPEVINQLRISVYGTIPPSADENPAVVDVLKHLQRTEFESVIEGIPAELSNIEQRVLSSPMAEIIKTVRNKLVAHAEIVQDGTDWKVWTIEGTKLTYANLDSYIDECTKAVKKLGHLVLRTAYAFEDQPSRDQRYADDYIDALVKGLMHQKIEREQKRQENLRRIQQFSEGDKD